MKYLSRFHIITALFCRLFIVASGHGSPCLDLRRVSADVADATVGADLGKSGQDVQLCSEGAVVCTDNATIVDDKQNDTV